MVERAFPLTARMAIDWDGDDQMVRVSGDGAAATETYHYDHAHNRVWAVSGNVVRFWFEESETDMPLSGGVATRYLEIADGSGALARTERVGSTVPVVELHYSDALHNLIMAMGPSAQVEASFVYGAFGEVVREYGGGDHRRQFNDKENDAASGLRYYGYRSYDPVMLRWISADPLFRFAPEVNLSSVEQHNLYQFSGNNPLRLYDPDGRYVEGLEGEDRLQEENAEICAQNPDRCATAGAVGVAAVGAGVVGFVLGEMVVGVALAGGAPILAEEADETVGMVEEGGAELEAEGAEFAESVSPEAEVPASPANPGSASTPSTPASSGSVNLASAQRTTHILTGDATGGGHQWPGAPGKTPFPSSWSADQIMESISDVATDPAINWVQQTGPAGSLFTNAGAPAKFVAIGERMGVVIKVVLAPMGEGIITAHPIN